MSLWQDLPQREEIVNVATAASSLSVITWNIGGIAIHRESLFGLIAEHSPHIVFLQETKLRKGGDLAMNPDLHIMGYHLIAGNNDLCVIHRLGINIAGIANASADEDFRVQRLALQVGQQRILIRHRHAHSGSSLQRKMFNDALAAEHTGDLVLDIGDFNDKPSADSLHGWLPLFPSSPTYRLNAQSQEWLTCIDGAVVSPKLAGSASVYALEPINGAQHKPVKTEIAFQPCFHKSYRWKLSDPVDMGAWSASQRSHLKSLIHLASGGRLRQNSFSKNVI